MGDKDTFQEILDLKIVKEKFSSNFYLLIEDYSKKEAAFKQRVHEYMAANPDLKYRNNKERPHHLVYDASVKNTEHKDGYRSLVQRQSIVHDQGCSYAVIKDPALMSYITKNNSDLGVNVTYHQEDIGEYGIYSFKEDNSLKEKYRNFLRNFKKNGVAKA